jgi:uncharacterized protein (TIGR02145 family)
MKQNIALLIMFMLSTAYSFAANDSVYFYGNNQVIYKYKSVNVDSVTFYQKDSIFVYKSNVVIYKEKLANIDSIIYYNPNKDLSPPIINNTITDSRDGNVYKVKQFGTQWWMCENLRYLPYVNTGEGGVGATYPNRGNDYEPRIYVRDYNGTNVAAAKALPAYTTYGVYYNGVSAATENVCPTGWHVPNDEEFKTLEMNLGMTKTEADKEGDRGTNQGSKMATNAAMWIPAQYGDGMEKNAAFGTSGFNAIPAGKRHYSRGWAEITDLNETAYFWTTTQDPSDSARQYKRSIYTSWTTVYRSSFGKSCGYSVRCVKD